MILLFPLFDAIAGAVAVTTRLPVTPTIRRDLEAALPQLFAQARRVAVKSLLAAGEPQAANALPQAVPYALDDLVADDWYPPSRHGLVDAV